MNKKNKIKAVVAIAIALALLVPGAVAVANIGTTDKLPSVVDNSNTVLNGEDTSITNNIGNFPTGRGNTLITATSINRVFELDEFGNEVWYVNASTTSGFPTKPMSAERLSNGNTLISGQYPGTVIEVNTAGNVVWEVTGTDLGQQGICVSDIPEAKRLPNGNTLIVVDRSCSPRTSLLIEVDEFGNVVWNFDTGVDYVYSVERMSNGNTLYCDWDCYDPGDVGAQVVIIDTGGNIVWAANRTTTNFLSDINAGFTDADMLPNGNILVTNNDENNDLYKIVEVDYTTKEIVWEANQTTTPGLTDPFDADRLPNGNTLTADYNDWAYPRAIEIDINGDIVWEIPNNDWTWWVRDIDRIPLEPEYINITVLSQKWNMVAVPFNYSVAKADLWVENNSVDYNWTNAVDAGIVADAFFGWTRTTPQGYALCDTIVPGYGYWLWAYYDCVLKVEVT